ncbi:MAG: OadG family protein [Nibricoccus sp.]
MLSPQLLAETPGSSSSLSIQTILLAVIAVALVAVAFGLAKLSRRVKTVEATATRPPFAPPMPATPSPVAPAVNGKIPPQVVAAISAAVHLSIGSNHRILAVGQPCPHRQAWSLEGRRQVFSSHKVR